MAARPRYKGVGNAPGGGLPDLIEISWHDGRLRGISWQDIEGAENGRALELAVDLYEHQIERPDRRAFTVRFAGVSEIALNLDPIQLEYNASFGNILEAWFWRKPRSKRRCFELHAFGGYLRLEYAEMTVSEPKATAKPSRAGRKGKMP